ncbi:MAG TPA: hypothetical protein VMB50_14770 [Myxococcales bacterium]|nr:hypothetical protein [Myxococcales bacterium]
MKRGSLRVFIALALVAACRYSVDPNTGKFHCASDSDCGGGWHCFDSCPSAGFSAYCVQNGSCDPCPSLQGDPLNCGTCGNACAVDESCVDSNCVPAVILDGGGDAGEDAGFDAGLDAGPGDAGADAGPDAGRVDAGEDGGRDAGREDAGADAGREDAGLDAGREDAGGDAGVDAGPDGGPADAGEDAGADGGDAGE